MQDILAFIGRLFQLAIALVLIAIGLVFFISLMLLGLLASAVWAVWCLLRGRRPVFFRFTRFHPGMDPRQAWSRFYGSAGPGAFGGERDSRTQADAGAAGRKPRHPQAIDVDVRDVPQDPPR